MSRAFCTKLGIGLMLAGLVLAFTVLIGSTITTEVLLACVGLVGAMVFCVPNDAVGGL